VQFSPSARGEYFRQQSGRKDIWSNGGLILNGKSLIHPMMSALILQNGGAGGILSSPLIMMVIVMGIFYVMLILPQQRQRKKTQAMLSAIKNGDKVVTTSGIYGTINGLDGDTVILKIADNVKIRISRAAIAQVEAEENAS
jgi:preprotein translocase subunit YajC